MISFHVSDYHHQKCLGILWIYVFLKIECKLVFKSTRPNTRYKSLFLLGRNKRVINYRPFDLNRGKWWRWWSKSETYAALSSSNWKLSCQGCQRWSHIMHYAPRITHNILYGTAVALIMFTSIWILCLLWCVLACRSVPYITIPFTSSSFFINFHHSGTLKNKAQRPTMRPQAFLGISSYRDVRDARRKSEYGNSYP